MQLPLLRFCSRADPLLLLLLLLLPVLRNEAPAGHQRPAAAST